MPNFNYIFDIPFATHNPSSDQPDMLTNNNSNKLIWDVDHHGFGDNLGGYHNVIHQDPQVGGMPLAPVNPPVVAGIGQTYVKTVGSDVQLFYESGLGVINQLTNSSGILPRVAVNFSVAPFTFVITINSSFNVTSVVRSAVGSYTVNFTTPLSSQFYYPSISAQALTGTAGVSNVVSNPAYVPTTTSINLGFQNAGSSSAFDPIFASVIIFL